MNNREIVTLPEKFKTSDVPQNVNIIDLDDEDEYFIGPRASFTDLYVFNTKGNFFKVDESCKTLT